MSSIQAAEPCQISLVYKSKGKAGYMAAAPSNAGLYQALYQEVANALTCTLSIQRYPKKRTHLLLKAGRVDLYPSTGFDMKRSQYLYYIPNGLYRHERYIGLTPPRVTSLSNISEIKDDGLTWIFEGGNTTGQLAEKFQVPYQAITKLSDERAIAMLSKGRKVFYRMIADDYEKYLLEHKVKDLKGLNIRAHKNCCKAKSHRLYTGMSRKSEHYREDINPHYKTNQPVSAENYPVSLVNDSLMFKIAQQMKKLRASGRVEQLYQHYIILPGHTP